MAEGIPDWIRVEPFDRRAYSDTMNMVDGYNLNTVCVSANCPNRYECFSKKTATFMILGNICTRNCSYCNIKHGKPEVLDENEPKRVAEAVRVLGIRHAVITCVTRDDLSDYGAKQFADTIFAIKEKNPDCRIEVLISDLGGNEGLLKAIADASPDIINHNIEVVKRLFPVLRPEGDFDLSIKMIKEVKSIAPEIIVKSGLMVGLGETEDEVIDTMKILREAGCDVLTIGQYLQPSIEHAEVKRYYSPDEFIVLRDIGLALGFTKMVAGPMVRSSYRAEECIEDE